MSNLQHSQGGCMAFTSGALANGTNTGTVKTTATIVYTIDGVLKSKSATDNLSIAMSVPAVASNGYATNGAFTGQTGGSVRLHGLFLDASGALSVVAGDVANVASLAAGAVALPFPSPQKDKCCIGVLRIELTASTTFIPGTTALNAAGVTASYLNLSSMPATPLAA